MDYIYKQLLQNILIPKVVNKQVPKEDVLAISNSKI